MKASQLIENVRLLVKDSIRTKYSDYEILKAAGAALDLLSDALSRHWCVETIREADIDITDGAGPLPKNFRSVASVQSLSPRQEAPLLIGQYRAVCGKLLANVGTVHLTYWRRILPPETGDDDIDLAERFLTPASRITALVLAGDWDKAEALSDATAQKAKTDGVGAIDVTPPMWGG